MRSLPDADLAFRDALDFVLGSELGARALVEPAPRCLAVFVRELLSYVHRLAGSCHLAEFTDHGLPHICSLVDRLSRWTVTGNSEPLVRRILPADAGVLLLATIWHDVGMLSQRAEDVLPDDTDAVVPPDVANWVRRTHIKRMRPLIHRLFRSSEFGSVLSEPEIERAFNVAAAHGRWPWEWSLDVNDAGLAAMLAVADLLDEDSQRCDSATLMTHRRGNALNYAHWIRHGLTAERVLVANGRISVKLAVPPQTDSDLLPVYLALRNHYLLTKLYNGPLSSLGAGTLDLDFDPPTGIPSRVSEQLEGWWTLSELQTQPALIFHLLGSFLPEALVDSRRLSTAQLDQLSPAALTPVDLGKYYDYRGLFVSRDSVRQSFCAILGT